MNTHFDRNKEIDHSLAIGAKAFAVGAVLILVLTLTNAPNYVTGDLAVSTASVAAVHDDAAAGKPAAAPAAANDSAPAHIDVPFTSNAADATELPPQF